MTRQNGNGRRSKPQRPATAQEVLDRAAPQDLQAEVGVLGSAILMFEVLDDLSQIVAHEDFYDPAHAILYRHLTGLYEEGRRFDTTLLIDRLKRAGDFESIGGTAYLSKIINSVPNAAHAVYYAELVRGHSTARKLIAACTETISSAYDPSANHDELVASAESSIARISDATIRGRDSRTLSEVLHESITALEQRMETGQTRVLDVGLEAFRNCMGLVPGGVTILAGRTSMGKTSCAIDIVRHVARASKRVYIASLEMTSTELADRMLSAQARVAFHRMANGTISQEDRLAIVEASSSISEWPIELDDRPTMTISQVGASARRVKRRFGRLDLLVIDYLQLVEPENRKDDRVEQLAKIIRGTKLMARSLQVPILALVQVNRSAVESADKRPQLHQLRGAGDLEQDADSVVFVHRPMWYRNEKPPIGEAETAEIIVAKNRNGPTDTYEALWWGSWMSWTNKASARQEEASRSF